MSTDDVQSVIDDRYPALLGYARGILGATSDDAQALVRSCMLVRGAAVLPIRVADSEGVYHVLRRRVLRRALRSRRQWWPALSRKARVESTPLDESYGESLRAARTRECRAILLLHLIDELSIQDAADLVAALVPRSRDVRAAALEVQEIVADGPPDLATQGWVAARLAAPTVRSARVPWLLAALVTVVVATTAVVVLPDMLAPADLGVRVTTAVPKENGYDACQMEWPPRGDELAGRDGDLADVPLIRSAILAWADETRLHLIGPSGAIHQRKRADVPTPDVSVLFAGRTARDQHAVLLCQGGRIARYIENTDRDPDLDVTELPSLSYGTTNRRVPFLDLGDAWLMDPDTTKVQSIPVGVARAEWTEHQLGQDGLVEDIRAEAEPDGCRTPEYAAPSLVRVDLPERPRYLKPRSPDQTARWLTAVHGGEEPPSRTSPGGVEGTFMPGVVWDVGTSPEELRVIRALSCAAVFDHDPTAMGRYTEVESLRVLAPLTVPNSGPQLTFRAELRRHVLDDGITEDGITEEDLTEEDLAAVTSESSHGYDELRPVSSGVADAAAGWTLGADNRWCYVAAGNARTARIEVTGKLTGATTGRGLAVAGPRDEADESDLPQVPVAVAFYDRRGEVIEASS